MPATPQLPALPGCTPLGLSMQKSFDNCIDHHKHIFDLGLMQYATCRDSTIIMVIDYSRTKANVFFKRPYDDCAHLGTMPMDAKVIPLKISEVLSDIRTMFDNARNKLADDAAARQNKIVDQMQQFRIGSTVSFKHNTMGKIVGRITKMNQKTITLITVAGNQWRVSPSLLTLL